MFCKYNDLTVFWKLGKILENVVFQKLSLHNIIKKIQMILDKNNIFEGQILAPLWGIVLIFNDGRET